MNLKSILRACGASALVAAATLGAISAPVAAQERRDGTDRSEARQQAREARQTMRAQRQQAAPQQRQQAAPQQRQQRTYQAPPVQAQARAQAPTRSGREWNRGDNRSATGAERQGREWNQRGYVRFEDPTWTVNSTNPRYITTLLQVGAANSTPGGLITGSAGGTANRLRGLYFGDGGQVLQYKYGANTFPSPTGTAAPTITQGGSWRVNDSGRRIGLDPEDDRRSVFGRLSFDVSDGVTLFAEASYNWQEVFFNAGPNLSTGQTLTATGCSTATPTNAPLTCNAFLYNTLGPAALAGITSVTFATTAADLPFRAINNRREVQRYVIGAEGDFEAFGNTARWDVYGQYGRADRLCGLACWPCRYPTLKTGRITTNPDPDGCR